MSPIKTVALISTPIGVTLGLLFAFLWAVPSKGLTPGASGFPVTRIACPCATDDESRLILLRAYDLHDSAAIAGLVARGHAIQLAAGTKVSIDEPLENLLRPDSATPVVQIQSGAHVGEGCYLWRQFIK